MNKFYKKGITVLEIVVVVTILGILIVIIFPSFSKMRESQVIKNAVEDVKSVLHSAKSQSLASIDSSEYGVYFQSDKIIIFKGEIFSVESPDNRITEIILPAGISDITLDGVSSSTGDLYFKRLSGTPSKTGTVTISTSSISKIITISGTGTISTD